MTQKQFVTEMMPYAEQASAATGIDPLVIMAQAAHESNWGASAPGNNYFGIKGKGQTFATHENVGGKSVGLKASFRKYASPLESFMDWARLMLTPRYADVGVAETPQEAFERLQAAGYATDPKYAQKLTSIANRISGVDTSKSSVVARGRNNDPQAVARLQTALAKQGYPIAVDGHYGPQTEAAVRAVQRQLGVTPDGKWGPQTAAAAVRSGLIDPSADSLEARDERSLPVGNFVTAAPEVAPSLDPRANDGGYQPNVLPTPPGSIPNVARPYYPATPTTFGLPPNQFGMDKVFQAAALGVPGLMQQQAQQTADAVGKSGFGGLLGLGDVTKYIQGLPKTAPSFASYAAATAKADPSVFAGINPMILPAVKQALANAPADRTGFYPMFNPEMGGGRESVGAIANGNIMASAPGGIPQSQTPSAPPPSAVNYAAGARAASGTQGYTGPTTSPNYASAARAASGLQGYSPPAPPAGQGYVNASPRPAPVVAPPTISQAAFNDRFSAAPPAPKAPTLSPADAARAASGLQGYVAPAPMTNAPASMAPSIAPMPHIRPPAPPVPPPVAAPVLSPSKIAGSLLGSLVLGPVGGLLGGWFGGKLGTGGINAGSIQNFLGGSGGFANPGQQSSYLSQFNNPALSHAVQSGQAYTPTGAPGPQGGHITSGPSGTFHVNGDGTYTSLSTGKTFSLS